MTIESAGRQEWREERRRWTQFYADRLPDQLRAAVAIVETNPPEQLRPHFDTFISLLAAADQNETSNEWLGLVDRLHPLPARWGYWPSWLSILHQATQKAMALGQPARQAEYMAYAADLLLNSGRLARALDVAREATGLARHSRAAWPLAVAGNVVAAALRSMARYDEAQAIVDETRGELTRMDPPQSAARAVMAGALLDLEQMDLHRHFKRLDDALILGQSLVERMAATEGIDPHDLATAYLRRATIVWVSARYQAAADDLKHAATLYRAAGDHLQAVFAEANLGTVYYSLSRYAEAADFKLAAIRAAEEVNARHHLVSELGDLGTIYIALGRMDLAFDYTNRMVMLAAELGNDAELSRGRGNRGYALMGLGRYQEALADIEFSLNQYREQDRLEGIIVTTVDLVLYLQGSGEVEQAIQLAEENYKTALRADFPHLHLVAARCLALFPPPVRQRALLEETLTLARKHGRPMDEAGCLFALAGLSADAAERDALYREGARLLHQMGAAGWLAGRSPADPPLLPMII